MSPHTLEYPSAHSPQTKFPTPRGHPFNKSKRFTPVEKSAQTTQTTLPIPIRSKKPIINWLQRKLVKSARVKRDGITIDETVPANSSRTSRGASIPTVAALQISAKRQSGVSSNRRRTISLNEEDAREVVFMCDSDTGSIGLSSLARDSTWSPGSVLEADEDASLRPIPPSSPPSPSPSRSSSSYLSDPRTFRSIAASTKPTTILSLDIHGTGMAHIAQAPATSSAHYRLPPYVRTSSSTNHSSFPSGASVSFSTIPPSPSRPSSAQVISQVMLQGIVPVQAPLHTSHHPRNNPRPSSPPLDNASVLTLASSAYAIPGLRPQLGHSTTPSTRGLGDSVSQIGGSAMFADAESTSQSVLGYDERLEERDLDASVRALRPRSSRRGSWESEASRWSARDQLGGPFTRERSMRTTNSLKTSALSGCNTEDCNRSTDAQKVEELDFSPLSDTSHANLITKESIGSAEVPEMDDERRQLLEKEEAGVCKIKESNH